MFQFLRLLRRQLLYFIKSSIGVLGAWLMVGITISYYHPSDGYFDTDDFDLRIFAGLAVASVALLTLRRNSVVQQAEFVSDYISRFYTDDNLWNTYHQLIYRYWDERFKVVHEVATEKGYIQTMEDRIKSSSNGGSRPPVAIDNDLLKGALKDKGMEGPTYHPWIFQGCDEEKQIDALLGFLNGVDYYCAKGHIGVGEIYRHMGTHLLTLRSREVISEYFKVNDLAWETAKFQRHWGVQSATKPARDLLDCIKAYDDLLKIKRISTLWR